MDFSIAEIDDYGLFPPTWALTLTVAFLVGAIFAARRSSPYWLILVWAIGSAFGISLALVVRWPLDWRPGRQLAEICLRVVGPLSLTTAALLWWRRRKGAGTWSVVGVAVGAFLASVIISVKTVEALYPGLYISGFLGAGEPVAGADAPRRSA